jgi:peptidoglycan/xylan/chitin deacetylase (PgdA/CDA1 family)
LALAVLVLAIAAPASAADATREISVIIRVDDIFMLKTDVRPMEIDGFLGAAEKHGAPVVLAAIPARLIQRTNRDGTMTEQLQSFVRRGHQIAQHGYDHRCPFTGTTDNEFYTPGIRGYSRDQRIAKILEGRRLLEAAIGRRVVSYVPPGGDGDHMAEDTPLLLDAGYIETPQTTVTAGHAGGAETRAATAGYGICMPGDEFTWGLTADNYADAMGKAQKAFLQAATEGRGEWQLKFHDHFTRAGYQNGITIRWLDEFLGWIESRPGIRVRYTTFEGHHRRSHPGFSTGFE